jgi:hypothetical protein
MRTSLEDSDSDSFQIKTQPSFLTKISNSVRFTREFTEKSSKRFDERNDAKNIAKISRPVSDEKQPELEWELNPFSSSHTFGLVKLQLVSSNAPIKIRWSVFYCNKEVATSKVELDDWSLSKTIEFSISTVDFHVFYETFYLKCFYEFEDDGETYYKGNFKIAVSALQSFNQFSCFIIFFCSWSASNFMNHSISCSWIIIELILN